MSLLLIWLVMALLVLELGALSAQLYVERSNPYIIAFRDGLSLPASGPPVFTTSNGGYFPVEIGGWDTLENKPLNIPLQTVLNKESYKPDLSTVNKEHLENNFVRLTDEEKEYYAVMHAKFILALDHQFILRECYGAYKMLFAGYQKYATLSLMRWTGAWDDICTGLGIAEQKQEARRVKTTFPTMQARMFPIEADCLPPATINGKGIRKYVAYRAHPELLAETLRKQMPADTIWDIPFYRYKRAQNSSSFSTNSDGLRSDEITLPKPKDAFRILCIGGSTTEEGSSNETTYPSLMRSCLQQAFPDHKIEVINAGLSGISSDWHLLRLKDYLAYEPDMVIIHVGVNDLWRRYNLKWAVNMLANSSHFARILFSSPAFQGNSSISNTRLCLEIMAMSFQQHGAAVAFASIAHPSTDLISKAEKQYFNYQAWSKWDLSAFSFDQYVNDIECSNKMLQDISKKYHAFYIPVAESIKGTTNIFWDFCHMTQEGINAKAKIIATFLEKPLEKQLHAEY